MSLASNLATTGQFLTNSLNGLTWSSPRYTDDHLSEATGGVPVYRQQELRKQHPALQEAWEEYLAVLYMCDDK